jgi:serine/threonine protein phosphatase 1
VSYPPAVARTFAIGDVHGELAALERVLAQLPFIEPDDTLLFVGDYLDRGPDSSGVVERLRRLPEQTAGKVVFLRGNHEDAWLRSAREPDFGFLTPRGNGCAEMYRSFVEGAPIGPEGLPFEELAAMIEVAKWLPPYVLAWMEDLPHWYEDEHAIYVHAGLEGEGTEWKHPRDSSLHALLWMREPDFFAGYEGKTLVFGHTNTAQLPPEDPARRTPWVRGPLIGIDTGAGRGGPLSCIELPARRVYSSADD